MCAGDGARAKVSANSRHGGNQSVKSLSTHLAVLLHLDHKRSLFNSRQMSLKADTTRAYQFQQRTCRNLSKNFQR